MKKNYFYYDYVFLLNPIQYINNREVGTYYRFQEIVSINIKSPINEYQKDKLIKDLKVCLNSIVPFVEGGDYKVISNVKIKISQPIRSGTTPIPPNR
jgi:hypothetical protein